MMSLLHRRADVGKSAREHLRFESASVRGRAHRRDLTRICLIAETSPALSFAARRTLTPVSFRDALLSLARGVPARTQEAA